MSNTEPGNSNKDVTITTSIAPWLSVDNILKAINFYKSAFGAIEVYRLETPDGALMVARLSVDGAEFWLSEESQDNDNLSADSIHMKSIRMILTVPDPDVFFAKAIKAGASQVYPVSEEHGWRLGRLVDHFGHHWDIGRPLI